MSPAELSGFCDPPSCVLHGIAPHPGGGFAVFREVLLATDSTGRGEGVNELVGSDGSVQRIARGVVVLRGEFDSSGKLRALVEPGWDHAAGALDTRVTGAAAIAEFDPSGEAMWVEHLDSE